jgi:hypothetical protein
MRENSDSRLVVGCGWMNDVEKWGPEEVHRLGLSCIECEGLCGMEE